jgi:hypothetical protein
MEKKSKVTKITKMDKKDSYGNTSFVIELENGDKGFYVSKHEDQKNFISGQEATYLIEEKEGKEGKKYFKITMPKVDSKWNGGSGKSNYTPVDPRIQMISFSTSYAKDLVVADKIKMDQLSKTSEEIFKNMIKLYETIK